MRATRLHGGRDQYCTGKTASSSRLERRKQSRPAANFYSIRAFTSSTKSAVDYDECRNCEHRKSKREIALPIALFVVGGPAMSVYRAAT
jgi:hypothetical protein